MDAPAILLNTSKVLQAVSQIAWPLMVGLLLAKLYPDLRKIMESRAFTVKVAGTEISVQQASEQLQTQIADLQDKVAAIRLRVEGGPAIGAAAVPASSRSPLRPARKVLWVDDRPSNNAYLIAKLRSDGVDVIEALSTDEAVDSLNRSGADVIITDMGRTEKGGYDAQAGLTLIRRVRAVDHETPIYVYSSSRTVAKLHDQIREAGGNGVTASPLELIESLKVTGTLS